METLVYEKVSHRVSLRSHNASKVCYTLLQETRMLLQALNRAMLHSRNQLEEEVNRQELIFSLAVTCIVHCGSKPASTETTACLV